MTALFSLQNGDRLQASTSLSKKIFRFQWEVFGGNATSGGVFGYLYLALGPNPLGHYYGSRFFSETRAKSASLEPLNDFLAYL